MFYYSSVMMEVLQMNWSTLICSEVFRILSDIGDGVFCENSWMIKALYYLCKKISIIVVWYGPKYVLIYSFTKNKWQKQPPEMFLGKGALNMCSKFRRENPCRSVISLKLLCSFIEIALRHGCSLLNLLHVFRTPFYKNTYGGLLLNVWFGSLVLIWAEDVLLLDFFGNS